MDLETTGRVVLVVGGTGYLGRTVSARLRAEGATVVTAGRSSGDVRMDASDDASVTAGVRSVVDDHGRIDLLVHAALVAFLCSGLASTISGASISSGHKVLGIAST